MDPWYIVAFCAQSSAGKLQDHPALCAGRRKGPGKPEWSEHTAQAQSTSGRGRRTEGTGCRPDAMRTPRPFKNDCKRRQTQKKQKSNQLQLQHQHQREMINSDGREGNVWACSYGPDWREPPWVVHLLPGPSAPRACWYACIGWCRKVEWIAASCC